MLHIPPTNYHLLAAKQDLTIDVQLEKERSSKETMAPKTDLTLHTQLCRSRQC